MIGLSNVGFTNSVVNHKPTILCFYGRASGTEIIHFKIVERIHKNMIVKVLYMIFPKFFGKVFPLFKLYYLYSWPYTVEHYKFTVDFFGEQDNVLIPQIPMFFICQSNLCKQVVVIIILWIQSFLITMLQMVFIFFVGNEWCDYPLFLKMFQVF